MSKITYYCDLPFIPIRKAPEDASEMTSMLLMGEGFTITATKNHWHQVICNHDGYEGWVYRRNTEDFFHSGAFQPLLTVVSPWLILEKGRRHRFISTGSKLPGYRYNRIHIKNTAFTIKTGEVQSTSRLTLVPARMNELFAAWEGVPYLWGGRSVFGVDCSGLTQVMLSMMNISIPRDASDQVHNGIDVDFDGQKKYDLAFFEDAKGKIYHTGIITRKGEILHASEIVRRDKLTTEGIQHAQTGKVTHKLACIRRM